MPERWLSVDEIAAHIGVNPDTIYKWITRKSMPAHKVGRLWKFLASEVDQWVKGGLAGASEIPPASQQSKETLGDSATANRPKKKPMGK